MLTIIVPMAGGSAFYPETEHRYPKIFQEILGRPMIQVVVENLMKIDGEKRFIFIVNDSDVKKYKLDNVLNMLTNNNCDIVLQKASTKGAVCSLLLAVKLINHDNPILISNADQTIDHNLDRIMSYFYQTDVDGGVVCFDSVHPQWSYARVIDNHRLVETAEKEPISRNAIAGLYYFARGRDFVESAMNAIIKDRSHGGMYYTSSVLNEMILHNKNLRTYRIESGEYHSFYSPEKIKEFERREKGVQT
jgi:dTDP-glucose pyrophosphorylase